MTIVFSWTAEEMQDLLQSCEADESLPLILKHFPVGAKVLESGCGAARYVRYLADRGRIMTGLEFSAETVAMVKSIWPDLDMVQGDCAASPFADSLFDGVISLGVVEHWPEGPQPPLKDIHRILKPNGIAVITVPCLSTVRSIKKALYWNEISELPRGILARLVKGKKKPPTRWKKGNIFTVYPAYGEFFEYRMSPSEFLAEVQKAGFEILEHAPVGHMDGIYHELNPLGLMVRFKNWTFFPSRMASRLNELMLRRPFFHPHMQAVVVRKIPVGD